MSWRRHLPRRPWEVALVLQAAISVAVIAAAFPEYGTATWGAVGLAVGFGVGLLVLWIDRGA